MFDLEHLWIDPGLPSPIIADNKSSNEALINRLIVLLRPNLSTWITVEPFGAEACRTDVYL
jgi:hypothetical protein